MGWLWGVIIVQLVLIFGLSGILYLIWRFTHNKLDDD